MSDLRTSFVINLAGNLQNRARQYSQALGTFSRQGSRHLSTLNRSVMAAGRGIERLGNRYTALLSGAGAVAAIRSVGQLEDRFLRLGIQAGVTDDLVRKLRDRVFEVAQTPDIGADPYEMLSAAAEIMERTGNYNFIQENIENIGIALQATGAIGKDVGAIMSEFEKEGVRSSNAILTRLDLLNEQGKRGAFTLQNIAGNAPRIMSAYARTGRQGDEALRDMGAALQMVMRGIGSPERSVTAFEALIAKFADDAERIQKVSGVQIFDPEELARGNEVMRPVSDLMREIVVASRGRGTLLSQIFDVQEMRALGSVIQEYQRTGAVETINEFLQVHADGAAIQKDAARYAESYAAATNKLKTAWVQFAATNLAEPIKELATWLNSLEPGTVQRWLNIAKWIGIAGGGLVVASKAMGLIANTRIAMGGTGGIAGNAAGRMMPVPVYIVNGPGALGGAAGRGRGRGGAGGALSRAGGWLSSNRGMLARAGAVAGAGVGGYMLGTEISKRFIEGTSFSNFLGRQIARAMSPFSEDARNALENERNARRMEGHLEISVTDERVRVRRMRSEGLDMDVDTGRMMEGL